MNFLRPCKKCGRPVNIFVKRKHPELCFECWIVKYPKEFEKYWDKSPASPFERELRRKNKK